MAAVDRVPERLVTANEIATLLSVSPKWVYSACRLYDMPHYQVGRYKRFCPPHVLAWLEETDFTVPTRNREE
jgi:hypothetical protein